MSDNWAQPSTLWQSSSFEDAPSMHSLDDMNSLSITPDESDFFMHSNQTSRTARVPRIDTHLIEHEYSSPSASSSSPDSAFTNITPSHLYPHQVSHVSPTATSRDGLHTLFPASYGMDCSTTTTAPFGYNSDVKTNHGLTAMYGLYPIQIPVGSAPHTPSPVELQPPVMPVTPSTPISQLGGFESYSFIPGQSSSQEQVAHRPTQRKHVEDWKNVSRIAIFTTPGVFIPQKIYRPHTDADRRRYIDETELMGYITFETQGPYAWGIALVDALRSRCKNLINKEEHMFQGAGPSVSIRIHWPGYGHWTRQIPTKDFRTPKQPITREKLAKNIANCVQRFIKEMEKRPMEEDEDSSWRVGQNGIKLEDLDLVSLHHVSQGSWQPQLRLRRPLHARSR